MGSERGRSPSSLPTAVGVLPGRFGKRANPLHAEREISCWFAGYEFKLRALMSEYLHLRMSLLGSDVAFPWADLWML